MPAEQVQLPGVRRPPPGFQQGEYRVLGRDQVAEDRRQRALRVGPDQLAHVVVDLLQGFVSQVRLSCEQGKLPGAMRCQCQHLLGCCRCGPGYDQPSYYRSQVAAVPIGGKEILGGTTEHGLEYPASHRRYPVALTGGESPQVAGGKRGRLAERAG